MTELRDDTIDLRDVVAALRRGWAWLLVGMVGGALIAAAVTALLDEEYEASASLVIEQERPSGGGTASSLLRGLELEEMFSLPGLGGSSLETDLAVLESRSMVSRIVERLGLQVRVLEPDSLAPRDLFSSIRVGDDVDRTRYEFRRTGDTYRVEGPEGMTATVAPGGAVQGADVSLTLRQGSLPDRFEIEIRSLEETLRRVRKSLEVENPGGEYAEVTFRAGDRSTAAALPNELIALYLDEREERDREVDLRRVEVVEAMTDSLRQELREAGGRLRRYHEQRGTFDPNRLAELERTAELRGAADRLQVELEALDRVLDREEGDTLSVADLAAFPSFLEEGPVGDVLSRILELHTERAALLQHRTERDPDVQGLTENIRYMEDQLLALARSYRSNVVRSLSGIAEELQRQREALAGRPGEEEAEFTLEGEVDRLAAAYVGLQAQVVQARLAAIRGTGTRQVDVAAAPRRPVFPKPFLNLAIGIFGGLLLGAAGLLVTSRLQDRVYTPRNVSRALGLPGVAHTAGSPLLLGAGRKVGTVLVIPVGPEAAAGPVARAIAETASLRGEKSALVDLSERGLGRRIGVPGAEAEAEAGSNGYALIPTGELVPEELTRSDWTDLRDAVRDLEGRFSLVVVALEALSRPSTAALLDESRGVVLVTRGGETPMADLEDGVRALAALGISIRGVVVQKDGATEDERAG